MKKPRLFFSSLTTVFASIATTFIVAYAFFKFAGPVPISVSQTTIEKENTFDVSGDGKVTVIPDIALINLGVQAERETVIQAQEQVNSTANIIQKELLNLKIAAEDLRTSDYQIQPAYEYQEGQRQKKGYLVTNNLEVKVRDFQKINQVIDLAVSLGATQIGSLSFTLDEQKLEDCQNQAREEAVAKAKEKAASLAKISGIKLGKIVNLQEDAYQPPPAQPLFRSSSALEEGRGETQIQPGSTEIRLTVTLSYEIL